MESTGLVRRIDDLGRVVIPKEIRQKLRIKEGDPLEIFVDKSSVAFKRYSTMNALREMAQQVCISAYEVSGKEIVVTDTYNVIASTPKEGVPRTSLLSEDLVSAIDSKEAFRADVIRMPLIDDDPELSVLFAAPIVTEGNGIGCIAILQSAAYSLDESDCKMVLAMAHMLGTL